MSNKETTDRVIRVVAEQLILDESEVKLESRIEADLGGDSLDAIEIVMGIEEEFEIEIPDAEAERVKTVAELVELVVQKGGK